MIYCSSHPATHSFISFISFTHTLSIYTYSSAHKPAVTECMNKPHSHFFHINVTVKNGKSPLSVLLCVSLRGLRPSSLHVTLHFMDTNAQSCKNADKKHMHKHTQKKCLTHSWSSMPGGFFLTKAP